MQNTRQTVDFFLGALTPDGFHGYFDTLVGQDGLRLYLIKSGPGCGKSTLMKQLAERGEGLVERVHCSSDPDSLDGAILWQKGAAVLDATAPHTLDAAQPGARERVVSLYHTFDNDRLTANAAPIAALFEQCGSLQARAARYIAAASALLQDGRRTAARCLDEEKLARAAAHFASRYLPRTGAGAKGREQVRLLSAVTPKGILVFRDTIPTLADTIIALQDESGAASRRILARLREEALARGHKVITCRCGMAQQDKIDHLIFPELRLAFVTSNRWHPMEFAGQKNIHCSRFAQPGTLKQHRRRLQFDRKAAAELLAQASAAQRQAKQHHDELEEYYKVAVDFAAVDTARDALLAELGLPV